MAHRQRDTQASIIPFPNPPTRAVREMAAVLAVDVVGYTILMEADAEDTHARLMRLRAELLDPAVAQAGGRMVKNTGDGFLASFRAADTALRCAVGLQSRLLDIAADFPAERRILFRMAINQCEVIVEADDIYGEGVNIAARLMGYAEAGDIVVTEPVWAQAGAELPGLPVFAMGELYLKNLARPVRAVGLRIGSARNLAAPRLFGAADNRPSIAVLPFRAAALEALCAEGIVEEITHALAGVKDLFVISAASTQHLAGENIDPVAIGARLGVRYLLLGSVRRHAALLRVRTELVDAQTGQIIRSDRHESDTAALFELQARIAVNAIRSIAPDIQEWELRRVMRKHPDSLTAYDLVLQARPLLYRLGPEAHSRARGLLQQAIALDPNYAPAYSHLAYWHIFHVGEGISRDPQADAVEAARVARAAIERDGGDALALAIFGHVQSFLFRDYDGALAHFDQAIAVGPNCAEAWSMSSVTLGYLGQGAQAVERAGHGLRLSPLDGHIYYKESTLAQAHYVADNHQAAVAWARRAQAHNPAALFNDRLLAASLAALGRMAEARQVAGSLLARAPGFRLGAYRASCPFRGAALATWIDRLREAGLPD